MVAKKKKASKRKKAAKTRRKPTRIVKLNLSVRGADRWKYLTKIEVRGKAPKWNAIARDIHARYGDGVYRLGKTWVFQVAHVRTREIPLAKQMTDGSWLWVAVIPSSITPVDVLNTYGPGTWRLGDKYYQLAWAQRDEESEPDESELDESESDEPPTDERPTEEPSSESQLEPLETVGVFPVTTADTKWFDEGEGFQHSRVMVSSNGNYLHNRDLGKVLEAYFDNYWRKAGAGDGDEIPIFRYGMLIRAHDIWRPEVTAQKLKELTERLVDILPAGWALHPVNEGTSAAIRVGAGSYDEHAAISDVIRECDRDADIWRDVLDTVQDVWDDADWYAFADIDEEWDCYK